MKISKRSYYIIYILIGAIIFCVGFILILKSNIEYIKACPDLKKSAIFLAIGGSLVASAIVYFLDLIKDLYKANLQKKINNIIFDGGIEFIYDKRDLDKYDALVRNLKKSIDISGYSLNAFNDSYGQILKEKFKNDSTITIRILLVNPLTPFSKEREAQENNAANTYLNSVNKIIRTYSGINNVIIKTINNPLTTMFYRIDDSLFVGPHLFKKPSKSTVTYELRKNGWLFEAYQNDFNNLWESGRICTELFVAENIGL
jgi:hypothetical protein